MRFGPDPRRLIEIKLTPNRGDCRTQEDTMTGEFERGFPEGEQPDWDQEGAYRPEEMEGQEAVHLARFDRLLTEPEIAERTPVPGQRLAFQ